MQTILVNPEPFLNNFTGKRVIVKLKWEMKYKGFFFKYLGFLVFVDSYMGCGYI